MYKILISVFLLLTLSSCASTVSVNRSYLPKPTVKFTQEQLDRTPVDVKETIRNREIQWNSIYDDYIK